MVLSENFRAEPLTDNLWRSNGSVLHVLTTTDGYSAMKIGILKFGKRAILKGPSTKEEQFFHTFRRNGSYHLGNPLEIDQPTLSTMAAPVSPAAQPAHRP